MELFSFPWLHPLCIGRQKVSEREGENEFIQTGEKKKQVLSLSKLACVMGSVWRVWSQRINGMLVDIFASFYSIIPTALPKEYAL